MRGATSKEEKVRICGVSLHDPQIHRCPGLQATRTPVVRSAPLGKERQQRYADRPNQVGELRLTRNIHEVVVSCKGNRRLGDGALHRSMISGQMRRWRQLYRRIGHT